MLTNKQSQTSHLTRIKKIGIRELLIDKLKCSVKPGKVVLEVQKDCL